MGYLSRAKQPVENVDLLLESTLQQGALQPKEIRINDEFKEALQQNHLHQLLQNSDELQQAIKDLVETVESHHGNLTVSQKAADDLAQLLKAAVEAKVYDRQQAVSKLSQVITSSYHLTLQKLADLRGQDSAVLINYWLNDGRDTSKVKVWLKADELPPSYGALKDAVAYAAPIPHSATTLGVDFYVDEQDINRVAYDAAETALSNGVVPAVDLLESVQFAIERADAQALDLITSRKSSWLRRRLIELEYIFSYETEEQDVEIVRESINLRVATELDKLAPDVDYDGLLTRQQWQILLTDAHSKKVSVQSLYSSFIFKVVEQATDGRVSEQMLRDRLRAQAFSYAQSGERFSYKEEARTQIIKTESVQNHSPAAQQQKRRFFKWR